MKWKNESVPLEAQLKLWVIKGLKGKERRAVIFIEKSGELKIHLKGKTEQSIFRG